MLAKIYINILSKDGC